MADAAAAIEVTGRVQGVGFRYFCYQQATRLNLVGWVRNNPDGSVSAWVEGDKADIETFADELGKGPPPAHVDHIDIEFKEPTSDHVGFDISR